MLYFINALFKLPVINHKQMSDSSVNDVILHLICIISCRQFCIIPWLVNHECLYYILYTIFSGNFVLFLNMYETSQVAHE